MPLTPEDKLTLEHAFLATGLRRGDKMTKSQMPEFFSQLGINASPELQNLLMDGLTLRGTIGIGYELCETFYTVWRDNDRLGMVKICFRGKADGSNAQSTIDISTLTYIANLIGVQKSEADIRQEAGSESTFRFADTTRILLGIRIPDDADAFDGYVASSKCILI